MPELLKSLTQHQRRRGEGFVEQTGMLPVGNTSSLYVMALPERPISEHRVVITHSFFEIFMLQRTEVDLLRALAGAGVPAIYVQAPGMGDSEGEPSDCLCRDRVDAMSAALVLLQGAAGDGRPCFVGARVGGLIAILAAQRRDEPTSLCVWDPVLDGHEYWRRVARLERIAATVGRKTGFEEPQRQLEERGRVTLLGVETTTQQIEDLKVASASIFRSGPIPGDAMAVALNEASAQPIRSSLAEVVEGDLEIVTLGLRDLWQLGLRKAADAVEPTVAWISGRG